MFTENGINVEKSIDEGLTALFFNELEAYKYACSVRSYAYRIVNKKNQHAGYGVPK
jgi:hypothetical protein